jgi:hypothetical protein
MDHGRDLGLKLAVIVSVMVTKIEYSSLNALELTISKILILIVEEMKIQN